MPYSWGTQWPGVFERHADRCPFSDGETCICGPLGYVATIAEPGTNERVSSPLLETPAEARAWRREQEWAVAPRNGTETNGNGRARPRQRPAEDPEHDDERVTADVARLARRRAGPERPTGRVAVRDMPSPRRRGTELPGPAPDRDDMPVSALIEKFLDAAEDGEARDGNGRPYSDDELAELEWALTGYVGSHFGELTTSTVRGRHVFRLIDELEDAGMPRSRLRSVVNALRELFDYATDLDLVRVNPATYVSLPPENAPSRRLADTVETRMGSAGRGETSGTETMVSERAIWMSVKLVTLAFICIALVLAAESV
jgi:hypothetical protein